MYNTLKSVQSLLFVVYALACSTTVAFKLSESLVTTYFIGFASKDYLTVDTPSVPSVEVTSQMVIR